MGQPPAGIYARRAWQVNSRRKSGSWNASGCIRRLAPACSLPKAATVPNHRVWAQLQLYTHPEGDCQRHGHEHELFIRRHRPHLFKASSGLNGCLRGLLHLRWHQLHNKRVNSSESARRSASRSGSKQLLLPLEPQGPILAAQPLTILLHFQPSSTRHPRRQHQAVHACHS